MNPDLIRREDCLNKFHLLHVVEKLVVFFPIWVGE